MATEIPAQMLWDLFGGQQGVPTPNGGLTMNDIARLRGVTSSPGGPVYVAPAAQSGPFASPAMAAGEGVVAPSANLPATQPSIMRQLMGQQQARLMAGQQQAALASAERAALPAGTSATQTFAMGAGSPPPVATQPIVAGPIGSTGLQFGPTTPMTATTQGLSQAELGALRRLPSAQGLSLAEIDALGAPQGRVAAAGAAEAAGGAGLAGEAAQAAGAAGLAGEAAGAGGGVARTLGQAYGSGGITGLGKGLWGMTGGVKGMMGRGAIAIPAMLAAQYIGAPVVGGVANMIAPGTGGSASDAVKDMASNAALGFTIAGPVGGIAGELYGGAKAIVPLASELLADMNGNGVAQAWGKATNTFNKAIVKTGNLDKATRDAINHGFVDQTTGKWVPGIYKQAQQVKSMAEDGKISHEQAVQMMNKLTDNLRVINYQAKQQKKGEKASADQSTANSLVMADMMNQYGKQVVDSGDAMAASIRAQIPNVSPQMAPLMETDAAQRAAFGRQLQAGYAAVALAQPTVDRMQAQLQAMQTAAAQQQLAAAQARAAAQAGAGSGSGKSFADVVGGK